jgi:DNA-binding CsgD family transcriptional regulator
MTATGPQGSGRRGRTAQSRPLLEREAELAALAERLSEAGEGYGSVTVIDAPAGKGKTRLLQATRDQAREAGMRVLGGAGAELERGFPFGLAIQLFEPLWFTASEAQRAGFMAGPARHAGELLTGAVSDSDSGEDQAYAIIRGLFWLCLNLAQPSEPAAEASATGPSAAPAGTPLVMLVDDLHWADAASLRFLAYLAQRIEALPIAMVVNFRTGEEPADREALAALRRASGEATLRPRSLSEGGVSALLAEEFPDADPAFSSACTQATGGNPFLLVELIEQVRAQGLTPDAELAERVADLPPESVLASVADRVASLPADAQMVSQALAVLGDGAALHHVCQLAGLDHARTTRAADVLAAAHLVQPGAPLAFEHPLIRAAIRRSMPPLDRGQCHRRAAAILHADGVPSEIVAAHLLAAPPPSPSERDPEAVEVLRAAARSALSNGAATSAVRLLERALSEHPAEDVFPEVISELAEAEVAAGVPHAVERLDDAMMVTGEVSKRTRLALTQGRALRDGGRPREAAEVLGAALAGLKDVDAELSDELQGAYIAATLGVPELAEQAQRQSELLRARIGVHPTPGQREALAHMALQAGLRGAEHGEVLELANRAWDAGALVEVDGACERTVLLITSALLFADQLERHLEICEEAIARARAQNAPTALAAATYCRAWARYEQGRIQEAADDAQSALDVRLDGMQIYARTAYGALACCHLQSGQLDEADTALSIIDHPEVRDSNHLPFLLDVRAELRLAQRRPAEALHDALRAGEEFSRRLGSDSPGALAWRSTAAFGHLALGEPDRARTLAEEELTLARHAGVTRIVIRDLRVIGLAQRGKRGLKRLAEAVSIGDRHQPRLEHILALVDLGAALRRDNQRSAAREPLKRALDLARRGGLTGVADRARTELLAAGARPRRDMLTGVDALTASQRRVADLAVQGLTTRQIAEALFITPKTVEYHLRQTYQKLDVSSREALAGVLAAGPSA